MSTIKMLLFLLIFPVLLLGQFEGWNSAGGQIQDKHDNEIVVYASSFSTWENVGTKATNQIRYTANGAYYHDLSSKIPNTVYGKTTILDSIVLYISSSVASGDTLTILDIYSVDFDGSYTSLFQDATVTPATDTIAQVAYAPNITLTRENYYVFRLSVIADTQFRYWGARLVYREVY